MPDEASNVENNFNYNYLLVQTILKMRDAQADNHPEQYWVYFEYGIGLVISHLDFHLRGEIEQDYAILQAAVNKINSTANVHDASKKTIINHITSDFANAHRFYIMQALNRVGVVRVEDEGVIDFESTDIDTFTKIVRDTHNTSAVGAVEAQDGKHTAPLVKPEMVLVIHEGKPIQMPKEDYMKLQQKPVDEEAPILMGEMPEDEEEEFAESQAGAEEVVEEEDERQDPEIEEKGAKKKFGWNSKV